MSFLNAKGQQEIGKLFFDFCQLSDFIAQKSYSTKALYFSDLLLGALPSNAYNSIPNAYGSTSNIIRRYEDILKNNSRANSVLTILERKLISPYRKNYTLQAWFSLIGNFAILDYMSGYLQYFTENFMAISSDPLTGPFYSWDWTLKLTLLFSVSLIPFSLLYFLNVAAFYSVARPSEYSTKKRAAAIYPVLSFFAECLSLILANASALPFSLGRRIVDTRPIEEITEMDALAYGGSTTAWIAYAASYVFLWFYLRFFMSVVLSILLEKQCNAQNWFKLPAEKITFVELDKALEQITHAIPKLTTKEEIGAVDLSTTEGHGFENILESGDKILDDYYDEEVVDIESSNEDNPTLTIHRKKLYGYAWEHYNRNNKDLPLNEREKATFNDSVPNYMEKEGGAEPPRIV